MWWHVEMAANAVISVSYFVIALTIFTPLIRTGQLLRNQLATATGAIFLTCALGHGAHAVKALLVTGEPPTMSTMDTWWTAGAHVLTAGVAIFYITLRRFYGRLLVSASMFDDVVERQRELDALRSESEARAEAEHERDFYAAVVRAINDNNQSMMHVKDLDGRYLMVNGPYEKVFGIALNDIIGRTVYELDPAQADTLRGHDERARSEVVREEVFFDTSDGRHYFDSVKFPVRDAAGNLFGTGGISLDITEQRQAATALAEARDVALAATAAKSTFLATMSHEIRTPMNAVIGMTDLLLETELDDEQHECLQTVRTSGAALLSVINDILDFSKTESGHLPLASAPFDLRDEIEGCLDLVVAPAASKGLTLACQVADDCADIVVGDAARIRQIVINLLSNAVKFTDEGQVLVTVVQERRPDERIQLTIAVADTGAGISVAGMGSLFRSFSQVDSSFTRVQGGTGLGLVISRRLAEAMGGDVVVESALGEGSVFTATVVVTAAPASCSADAEVRATLAGRSVLVVGEDPTYLRSLEMQLSSLDMRAVFASGPDVALEMVEGGLRFDAAVLDLDNTAGIATRLAAALRAVVSHPVLLVSGLGRRPRRTSDDIAAVLTRPVHSRSLRTALATSLNASSSSGSPGSAVAVPTERATRPLRILLADDNRVNQRVAQMMIDKLGHTVNTVSNGRAAVDAAASAAYDVILMDVVMPVLDGLGATRMIRAQLPPDHQPYIIAMTANALVEHREACAAAGMESYLAKPVRGADLKNVLDRVTATLRPAPVSLPEETPRNTLEEFSTDSAGTQPIDQSVLVQLAEDCDDTDGSLVQDLVENYLHEAPDCMATMTLALDNADVRQLGTVAHTWRSTSALVGAVQLACLLQEAEQIARKSASDLTAVVGRIDDEHARVVHALHQRELLPQHRQGDAFPPNGPARLAKELGSIG